jgi:hypothetical protein
VLDLIESGHVRWGVMPPRVAALLDVLRWKAACAMRQVEQDWPTQPGDIEGPLAAALHAANEAERASNDIRSLLTAYAHRFHQPRPTLAVLARAQGTSPQGFTRRYTEKTVGGIAELLSPHPDVDRILTAFPSLERTDLVTVLRTP